MVSPPSRTVTPTVERERPRPRHVQPREQRRGHEPQHADHVICASGSAQRDLALFLGRLAVLDQPFVRGPQAREAPDDPDHRRRQQVDRRGHQVDQDHVVAVVELGLGSTNTASTITTIAPIAFEPISGGHGEQRRRGGRPRAPTRRGRRRSAGGWTRAPHAGSLSCTADGHRGDADPRPGSISSASRTAHGGRSRPCRPCPPRSRRSGRSPCGRSRAPGKRPCGRACRL